MRELIITSVLKWLAGITADQWKAAVDSVIQTAERFRGQDKDDAHRAAYWLTFAGDILRSLKPFKLNLLREVALAFARKKGLV
jgi:hypothetical protein